MQKRHENAGGACAISVFKHLIVGSTVPNSIPCIRILHTQSGVLCTAHSYRRIYHQVETCILWTLHAVYMSMQYMDWTCLYICITLGLVTETMPSWLFEVDHQKAVCTEVHQTPGYSALYCVIQPPCTQCIHSIIYIYSKDQITLTWMFECVCVCRLQKPTNYGCCTENLANGRC